MTTGPSINGTERYKNMSQQGRKQHQAPGKQQQEQQQGMASSNSSSKGMGMI